MRENNEFARLTIDIVKTRHTRLKRYAASQGKSMRDVIDCLIDQLPPEEGCCSACTKSHTPNEETIKAIKETKARKGLKQAKDAEDLFKKLGI